MINTIKSCSINKLKYVFWGLWQRYFYFLWVCARVCVLLFLFLSIVFCHWKKDISIVIPDRNLWITSSMFFTALKKRLFFATGGKNIAEALVMLKDIVWGKKNKIKKRVWQMFFGAAPPPPPIKLRSPVTSVQATIFNEKSTEMRAKACFKHNSPIRTTLSKFLWLLSSAYKRHSPQGPIESQSSWTSNYQGLWFGSDV